MPVDLMISQRAPKHGFRPRHIATLSPCELARRLRKTRRLVHLRSRSQSTRDPFPSSARKGSWSAGWGVDCCRDVRRIARASQQTCIEPFLHSAPHPALRAPLCPEIVTESTNGRSLEQPPVAGPEPVATTDETCGEARDRSGVFLNPNSCMGVRARTSKEGSGSMPQETRIVGLFS